MSAEEVLGGPYRRYVATVSPVAYAISFSLASFLWQLALDRQALRLLDLGSGFSSYVFRRFAQATGPGVEVCSVDDDPGWLSKTRAYLFSEGVSTLNLRPWADLSDGRGFDIVLHDLGTVASRIETVAAALELVRPGGALVLDDMDVDPYRRHVEQVIARSALAYRDVAMETRDERGRYSWIVLR